MKPPSEYADPEMAVFAHDQQERWTQVTANTQSLLARAAILEAALGETPKDDATV